LFDIRDLFSNQKKLVGLDIGSSSLKLVEIKETPKGYILNQGYMLSRFFQISVPRGVIVDGVLVEQEELSARIKELFKLSGCRTKNVVTSLSGHSVITKKVSFATMNEGELRDLIHDEASKYLPFDNMEEVSFDFQILGENEFNPNLMEVLLVAAKKEIINSYTSSIIGAGLLPVIMDVDSFALETMYEENYDSEETDISVIVNIGASITNINVVKQGMSIFTRDFTLGGNTVTEALQNKLGLTFEDAEKVKIEGAGSMPLSTDEPGGDILAFAEPLCLEIERSVDYFRSTYGSGDIKQVMLSGGGAKIPGISAELTQRLNITTEIINPFRKIGYDKKVIDAATIESIGPIAAVAVGLALRKVGDK
jgi:type IV pilus assembly protein PilM